MSQEHTDRDLAGAIEVRWMRFKGEDLIVLKQEASSTPYTPHAARSLALLLLEMVGHGDGTEVRESDT